MVQVLASWGDLLRAEARLRLAADLEQGDWAALRQELQAWAFGEDAVITQAWDELARQEAKARIVTPAAQRARGKKGRKVISWGPKRVHLASSRRRPLESGLCCKRESV